MLDIGHFAGYTGGHWAEDFHIGVFVFPMFEEDGTQVTVHVASIEGEGVALGGGFAAEVPERVTGRPDVGFWQGNVSADFEAGGHVGVAEGFYAVFHVVPSLVWSL